MRSIRLTIILIALLVFTLSANAETIPTITKFKGGTLPGVRTQAHLSWEFEGPTQGLLFRLFVDNEETASKIFDSSIREYVDKIGVGQHKQYKLQAVINNLVVAEQNLSVATLSGGFAMFTAGDTPSDGGGSVDIAWKIDEKVKFPTLVKIFRSAQGEGKWEEVGVTVSTDEIYVDNRLEDGKLYNYMLQVKGDGAIYESRPVTNITTAASWFDMRKINMLLIAIFVLTAVIWYVLRAHKDMFIRKIAGLEAVEEAVGRATEMGRSVLFVPGILDLDDVQTLAGLNILGSVAKLTAQYETGLDVPVSRSLVMSNGREVVKEAYLSVGRPDYYHDDMVHYVTDEQFGYVAAVDGMMVREEPAACFYMGAFFAESLILAETGNSIGAIQIAGTAMPSQLPFFVAACDYTLIGEELFAASAYLSGDQRMIASLRGQDVGKALAMFSILFGSIAATAGAFGITDGFFATASDIFNRLFALNY